MKKTRFTGLVLSFAVALSLCASGAFAAGFFIVEQGVSGLGNAYSGWAASAEDPSTIFYNPAGLTRLEGQQASVGAHYIIPSMKFTNDGTTNAPAAGGTALSGGNGGDAGDGVVVPSAYYTYNMGNMAFGIGIFAPFGLTTDYEKTWVGRYYATESAMETLNINPTFAYKLDKLSLGFGLSAQRVEATLSNMTDFGALLVGAGTPGIPLSAISNSTYDVESTLEADGWAYGFNIGLLYEVNDDLRFGMSYRSRFKYDLDGDATFTTNNTALAPTVAALFPDQDASTEITLPDMLSMSGYYDINENFAVMADLTWTHWSTFDKLEVQFKEGIGAGGTTTEKTTPFNWENTWRASIGATYKVMPNFPIRCGLAYDQSPIPDETDRSPRVPDADRIWIAVGAGYDFTDFIGLDFAYTHIIVDDAKINNSTDANAGTISGEYESDVNIASLQLNLSW